MVTRARADYEFTARDRTRAATRSVENNLQRLDRNFKALGGTLAAVFGGRAAISSLDRVTADLQRLQQVSRNLDFPVERLQQYFIAARQAGQDTGQFSTALQRFVKRASQAADGTGEAVDAFRELGLSARELESLNTADALEDVVAELDKISSDDYVRLAQKIFDSEGVANIKNTTAAFREANGELEKFVLTAEELQQAGYLRQAFDDASTAAGTLTGKLNALLGSAVQFIRDIGEADEDLSLQGVRQRLDETAGRIFNLNDQIRRLQESDAPIAQTGLQTLNQQLEEANARFDRLVELEAQLEAGPRTLRISAPAPGSGAGTQTGTGGTFTAPEFTGNFQRPVPVSNQVLTFFQEEPAEEAIQNVNRLNDAARDLGFTFTSAFEDAVLSGEKLQDVLKGIAQDIARIILRTTVTQPLANAITGGLQGAFAGGGGGSIFDSFDSGGSIKAGQPALVGVGAQPELFVPSTPGTMIPNADKTLGNTVNVTIQAIDAAGVYDVLRREPRKFGSMVQNSFARAGARVDVR